MYTKLGHLYIYYLDHLASISCACILLVSFPDPQQDPQYKGRGVCWI